MCDYLPVDMIRHPRQHKISEDYIFINNAVRTSNLIAKFIPNCIKYRIRYNQKVTSAPLSVFGTQANSLNTTRDPLFMSRTGSCKTCNLFVYATISVSNHNEPNGLTQKDLHETLLWN
jgi:hypothetical protein